MYLRYIQTLIYILKYVALTANTLQTKTNKSPLRKYLREHKNKHAHIIAYNSYRISMSVICIESVILYVVY